MAILLLAFAFIFQKLSNNKGIADFEILMASLSQRDVVAVLSTLVLLMLLNWFIESLKWKYLLTRVERISTWKAVESVFCGLTWAVFTPNRIGEFGGRVFFLSPRKRIIGIVSMAVGAVGQMVTTNVIGSIALLWFVATFMELNPIVEFGIAFLVTIFCSFFVLLYFNIQVIDRLLSRIKFIKPFRRFFSILAKYKTSELLRILGFSITRYLVFSSQYCIIISFLIPGIPILSVILLLFVLFFIQSALPSLDLLDISVRASTAGYLFTFITDQEVAIMAATACIWFINLIVPAILGSVFVLKLNFFGSNRN